MENQTLLEIFKKYLEFEKLNEATTTGMARGSYKPPVRPGITYWDPEDLQPFVNSVSKYTNAELYHDSLDGHIDAPKKEIAKKEKIAKKIQKTDFAQDAPVEGDDEYTKAPFKILTPSYREKGDKSGKKPRMKKNKFKDGMTWDNYGEWHVDHIQPISAHSIQEIGDDEFMRCWSLTNLQPMWGEENIKKSNKILF